jgi:hypothetical protein
MALSNAERQRRFIERLKARSVTNDAPASPVSNEDIGRLLAPHIQRLEAEFEQRVQAEVERRVKTARQMPPVSNDRPAWWLRMDKAANLPPVPDTPELREQVQRLRALWKSGRDKYRSFFAVLNEVRMEIGDDALKDWCFDRLRIAFSAINVTANILGDVDGKIARASLKAARARK